MKYTIGNVLDCDVYKMSAKKQQKGIAKTCLNFNFNRNLLLI